LEERRAPVTEQRKKSKMPKNLRLPRIDDGWMFYNRERLHEIQAMEEKAYADLKAQGTVPPELRDEDLLNEELATEKAQLLSEGFKDWTKNHYNSFVKASAKYGRYQYDKIALDIGKTEEEVKAYSEVFWVKGEREFTPAEWDKIVKNVEKGEKKLEDIARLTKATQELIARFKNPWEELTFQPGGPQGREKQYSTEEDRLVVVMGAMVVMMTGWLLMYYLKDCLTIPPLFFDGDGYCRYLLCLTNYFGYGNWDKVKMALRKCDRFRFDYFLRSCSSEQLAKRCEQLMRSAEKENSEYEKKKQASEENRKRERDERLMDEAKREKDDVERKKRLLDLDQKISEESSRHSELTDAHKAVEARYHLLKQSQGEGFKPGGGGDGGGASVRSERESKPASSGARSSRDSDGGKSGFKGVIARVVPEDLLPELCFLIDAHGPAGIQGIIHDFQTLHSEVSKRQIELKINELATKRKKDENDPNARVVWVINSEYEHLLKQYSGGEAEEMVKKRKLEGGGSSAPPRKRQKSAGAAAAATAAAAAAAAFSSHNNDAGSHASDKKRKRVEDDGPIPSHIKKAKNAITLFMQDNRQRARDAVGGSDQEAIKSKIKEWWKELSADEKKPYHDKAQADQDRFEKEVSEWRKEQEGKAGSA